ncbi:sensor histidine kinase [Aquiflexum sp.]|uniref:sensor histidine kinase n=1 Tax=Aquiflexum sp. TaxID=1872584 RepID=UPI0035930102
MKESPLPFRQIEWWLMTLLFLAIILVNVLDAQFLGFNPSNKQMSIYASKAFIPIIMYLGYYLMHIRIIPNYQENQKNWKLVLFSVLVFFGAIMLCGAFSMNAGLTHDFFMPFYFNSVAIYIGYLILVYIFQQILLPPRAKDFQLFNVSRLIALYFFVFIFLVQYQKIAHHAILIVYSIVLPSLVLMVIYNFFLVYGNYKIGKTKLARIYYWGLMILVGIIFFILAVEDHNSRILLFGVGTIAFLMLVLFPLSNLFFKKYDSLLSEINTLSYKVDQGSANLSFLRSQINPHFLFNALNTLYGTALQENAERTSEGVQKLGDMMRFMLHENNQDKIPVEREKEYLVNYVDLQLLRIKEQENIEIVFSKGEDSCSGEIAPMLLIPFVENAFKHGISLQKKSWVKISLRCLAGSVHLDVNNSIHRSNDDDPERKASGIGLENVRQRLSLLYPGKHELVIRENEMEYFVHLSIKL